MVIKKHKDIDFALVEEKRPPLYTAMKYWGKKPHNIWRKYIETYTKENDIYLDPFSGSAIGAFEAVKAKRKAIAFDINPLTSFMIEVFCSSFNKELFSKTAKNIINEVKSDNIYKTFYTIVCPFCNQEISKIENFKWNNGQIYSIAINSEKCGRKTISPSQNILKKSKQAEDIDIPFWYPNEEFYNSPSFSKSFIKNIGGKTFDKIWTKRNLYVLSMLFHLILNEKNDTLKKQLLFGFIQTVHLSSKMCVPRREAARRDFSTSWGRAAYLCSNRQMEMNPLLIFERSCLGKKQSVLSSLGSFERYIGKIPKIKYVDKSNKSERTKNWDIKYGIIDINTLPEYIDKNTIDFILTDPPYGGLVQYLDLSYIWLIWLKHYNNKFMPNLDAEITIKRDIQPISIYQRKFTNGINNLYYVLKKEKKIVFTFHNKDLKVWNAFLLSIMEAGFKIEKIIHQQNRRTGESNVANPYGTSASDFYIRCIKGVSTESRKTTDEQFEQFVIKRAKDFIIARGEPTPFQILFNGLLGEISKAGFELYNFDTNIQSILSKYEGSEFIIKKNSNKLQGLLWDVKNKDNIRKIIPLSDRVDRAIINILNSKVAVSFDDVLAEIFIKYPNGLTPDIKTVKSSLEKYACKSGSKWIYKKK